jgi:hypothetical protein
VAVEEPPAGTLLERRQSRPGVLAASSDRECRSMRVHIDRKWLGWLDGDMITLVVITLVIVIALVY